MREASIIKIKKGAWFQQASNDRLILVLDVWGEVEDIGGVIGQHTTYVKYRYGGREFIESMQTFVKPIKAGAVVPFEGARE